MWVWLIACLVGLFVVDRQLAATLRVSLAATFPSFYLGSTLREFDRVVAASAAVHSCLPSTETRLHSYYPTATTKAYLALTSCMITTNQHHHHHHQQQQQ